MTAALRSTLLTCGQVNTSERSAEMNLAGRPAFVLCRVIRGTPPRIKKLNASVSKAATCFSSPEVPRQAPDSRDKHVTVIPTTQPPELLGYHPPNWLASVPLNEQQIFFDLAQGKVWNWGARPWTSIPETERVHEPVPRSQAHEELAESRRQPPTLSPFPRPAFLFNPVVG
jgi:hypothetical protein